MHDQRCYTVLSTWTDGNKFSLNIGKTVFMVILSRQRLATFNNHELRVIVDNEPVRQVNSTKTVGLTLDENLSWKSHVENISKKIPSAVGALKHVRGLIDQETALKVYHQSIKTLFKHDRIYSMV